MIESQRTIKLLNECQKVEINLGKQQINDQEIAFIVKHINPSVEFLNLGESQFSYKSIICLTEYRWTKLVHLHLVNNQLGNKGMKLMGKSQWSSLKTIGLWKNQIESYGISHLSKLRLKSLQVIELGANKIGPQGVYCLSKSNWKNMKWLFIQFNKIEDVQVKNIILSQWPNIQSISLCKKCHKRKIQINSKDNQLMRFKDNSFKSIVMFSGYADSYCHQSKYFDYFSMMINFDKTYINATNSVLYQNLYLQNKTMGCGSIAIAQEITLSPKEPQFPNKVEQLLSKSQFEKTQQIADNLFKEGKFLQAITVYQKIIESNYIYDYQIQGIGNSDHSVGRYEWFIYKWYDENKQKGKIKGNPYDALSLCYCQIKSQEKQQLQKGIIWYEEMIGEIQSYSLYMGYANILYNRDRFEEAIKMYNKVLQLKPTLVNSQVCIALCYLSKRIDKVRSVQIASNILKFYPDNIYALFIVAKNEKNAEQKLKKLKEISQKHPQYVRSTNQIGRNYTKNKQYGQAIKWYKKCLQIAPQYVSAYNHIGANLQSLKQYTAALDWFFKAVEKEHQFKTAYKHVTEIIDLLDLSDQMLFQAIKKYSKINLFWCYYYFGLVYYQKKKPTNAIKWLQLAQQINPSNYKLLNALGMHFDQINDYENSQKYYLKCIEQNPKFSSAYFNLGIISKKQGKIQKAIEWYKKSIQVNPQYSLPYNNIGNIYKNTGDYTKAIQYYKKAIQFNSTYTLSFTNLGICYLSLRKYHQAFDALQKAKILLPNDNNHLSQKNKIFLKKTIQKFDKEIEKHSGQINGQQKQALKSMLKSDSTTTQKSNSAFKEQIIQIINLIYADKFGLNHIEDIYKLMKILFAQDEDYFHIIPQIFIQYFQQNITNQLSHQEINQQLAKAITKLINQQQKNHSHLTKIHQIIIKMKHYDIKSSKSLLNQYHIQNYQLLCAEISKIIAGTQGNLSEFIDLVQDVRKRSNGIQFTAKMRIPKYQSQQFRHRLSIISKLFKKYLNQEKCKQIARHMQDDIKKEAKNITIKKAIEKIQSIFSKEINNILSQKQKNKQKLNLTLYDLIKGKITFNSIEDLSKGIEVTDYICFLRGYEVIGIENRLTNREAKDVIVTVKIKDSICEFHLTLKHTQQRQHILQALHNIQGNIFGSLVASYAFMSRNLSYPLVEICQQIQEGLGQSEKEDDKKVVEAAQYVINTLKENK